MPRNIFTYTAPGGSYPEFLSINRDGAGIRVTVRHEPSFDVMQSDNPPLAVCGHTAEITLTREQAVDLMRSLQAALPSAV